MAACGVSSGMNRVSQPYNGDNGVNTGVYSGQGMSYSGTNGSMANYPNQCIDRSSDDCVQVIRTMKRVMVPCTRNVVKNVTVQVPRTFYSKVRKELPYQDFETRTKPVPYTTQREEIRYVDQNQPYTTMVPRVQTKMVPVTRRVPKTVYVNETTTEPRQETVMVPEIRQRNVRVPYKVQVPETTFRNEMYHVPVTKWKTVFESVPNTIYEPRTKQQCSQVTEMVTKTIPVYNAIPKDQMRPRLGPYPNLDMEFKAADVNRDGALNLQEYTNARAAGMLQSTAARPVDMGYSANQMKVNSANQANGFPSSNAQLTSGSARYHRSNEDGPETPLN